MLYLLLIGLVILLGVLLVARSAQQGTRSPGIRRSNDPTPTPTPGPVPAPAPAPVGAASVPTRDAVASRDRGRLAAGFDSYLWDARRIAHRHESRADTLDFFGVLVSILAGLVALGTAIGFSSTGDQIERDAKVLVAVSAGVSVLGLIAVAAVFFGFGAVVRNTSRSLAISAGVALDSYDPPDDEPEGHSMRAPSRAERTTDAYPPRAPEHSPERPAPTASPWMPPDR